MNAIGIGWMRLGLVWFGFGFEMTQWTNGERKRVGGKNKSYWINPIERIMDNISDSHTCIMAQRVYILIIVGIGFIR